MTLNCIPFKDTIEGNTNRFYTNEDMMNAEASMDDGSKTYMKGILKISDLNNELIGARQGLYGEQIPSSSPASFQGTETLHAFGVTGAQVFTMVNKNPNNLGDVDETDEIYYLNNSNKLYKVAINDGGGTQLFGFSIDIDNSALNGKTPVSLKYIINGVDTYLVCITSDNNVFALYFNADGTLTGQSWTSSDEYKSDIIYEDSNSYFISDEGNLYYNYNDSENKLGPDDVIFMKIALDKNSGKLYALTSSTTDNQSIYVFNLSGAINQSGDIDVSRITYSKFPLNADYAPYYHMALDIKNEYMNDTNNKIYLSNGGTEHALFSVTLTYKTFVPVPVAPICKEHNSSVYAMCGDTAHKKWGLDSSVGGDETTILERNINNCNWSYSFAGTTDNPKGGDFGVVCPISNTLNNVESVPVGIVDISTNINGLQIDSINNNIFIYSSDVYYTYPLNRGATDLTQKTYGSIADQSIEAAEGTITSLKGTMLETQETIQNLNAKFDEQKTPLNEQIEKLNVERKSLNKMIGESKGHEGNSQNENKKYNMIIVRYLFWILTAIITIILLALNYYAPDIITIEMIIVFAALMMIAVYLNRQYFDKYLDPIFSNLKTGLSSAISPLYSN